MEIFKNLDEFQSEKFSILTIGTFDGVHLGHQKILKKLNKEAKENNLESTVLTFFPHPRTILNPSKPLVFFDYYRHFQYLKPNSLNLVF